jgi:hypothetical protein
LNTDQEKFFLQKLASIEGKLDAIMQLFLKAATREEPPVSEQPPAEKEPPRDYYGDRREL